MDNPRIDFSAMNRAIIDYINSKLPKDPNKAHVGKMENGRVIIGNSSYNAIPTVDLYYGDGSKVACLLPENISDAVVVGVV